MSPNDSFSTRTSNSTSSTTTSGGRIGLLFLLVSALGMTMAAIFTSDPITASQDELTTHGNLHGLGALLGIPSFPIAAALISWSLARNRVWSLARRALLWAATLTWIGLLVFVLSVALLLPRGNGEFGPDVLIGWPNRLLVLAYSLWLMVVAWQAIRVRSHRRSTEEADADGNRRNVHRGQWAADGS